MECVRSTDETLRGAQSSLRPPAGRVAGVAGSTGNWPGRDAGGPETPWPWPAPPAGLCSCRQLAPAAAGSRPPPLRSVMARVHAASRRLPEAPVRAPAGPPPLQASLAVAVGGLLVAIADVVQRTPLTPSAQAEVARAAAERTVAVVAALGPSALPGERRRMSHLKVSEHQQPDRRLAARRAHKHLWRVAIRRHKKCNK